MVRARTLIPLGLAACMATDAVDGGPTGMAVDGSGGSEDADPGTDGDPHSPTGDPTDTDATDSDPPDAPAGLGALPTPSCADEAPGGEVGDCAATGRLRAADGSTFDLATVAGKVVLIDHSAIWCSTCKLFADHGQGLLDTHGTDRLAVITVLYENAGFEADVTQDDLVAWRDAFELSHPVLADEGRAYRNGYGGRERPLVLVVGTDGRIVSRTGANAAQVDEAVATALGE